MCAGGRLSRRLWHALLRQENVPLHLSLAREASPAHPRVYRVRRNPADLSNLHIQISPFFSLAVGGLHRTYVSICFHRVVLTILPLYNDLSMDGVVYDNAVLDLQRCSCDCDRQMGWVGEVGVRITLVT